jgi:hypothetical protein
MARLLARAPRSNTALRELAEDEARRRFAQVRTAAAQPTLRGRVFGVGLEMHRRGYVPSGLMSRMSRSYFEACAAGPG